MIQSMLGNDILEVLGREYWLHSTEAEAHARRRHTVIDNPSDGEIGWITFHGKAYSYTWCESEEVWKLNQIEPERIIGHSIGSCLRYTEGAPGS